MRRIALVMAMAAAIAPMAAMAEGPYKVLNTAKVGGEGGFDYVYADSAERKLYIPRLGAEGKITVFNLDTLAPAGVIPGSGHGVAISAARSKRSVRPASSVSTVAPARFIVSTVGNPTTGTSKRMSCLGLLTFTTTSGFPCA